MKFFRDILLRESTSPTAHRKILKKNDDKQMTGKRLCNKNTVHYPPALRRAPPKGGDIWPKGHIRARCAPRPKAVQR